MCITFQKQSYPGLIANKLIYGKIGQLASVRDE